MLQYMLIGCRGGDAFVDRISGQLRTVLVDSEPKVPPCAVRETDPAAGVQAIRDATRRLRDRIPVRNLTWEQSGRGNNWSYGAVW